MKIKVICINKVKTVVPISKLITEKKVIKEQHGTKQEQFVRTFVDVFTKKESQEIELIETPNLVDKEIDFQSWQQIKQPVIILTFKAVHTYNPEEKENLNYFHKYPYGTFEVQCVDLSEADQFDINKEYYINIEQ